MRTYNITRSTMAWNRIVRDPDSKESRELAEDVQQMLRYDDRHVHGEDVELPEGVAPPPTYTSREVTALISLAHTVRMWVEHGSDTELHDAWTEHEPTLRYLVERRNRELIDNVSELERRQRQPLGVEGVLDWAERSADKDQS